MNSGFCCCVQDLGSTCRLVDRLVLTSFRLTPRARRTRNQTQSVGLVYECGVLMFSHKTLECSGQLVPWNWPPVL